MKKRNVSYVTSWYKYNSLICDTTEHDHNFQERYGIDKTHYRNAGEAVDSIARTSFGLHRFSDYIAFRIMSLLGLYHFSSCANITVQAPHATSVTKIFTSNLRMSYQRQQQTAQSACSSFLLHPLWRTVLLITTFVLKFCLKINHIR